MVLSLALMALVMRAFIPSGTMLERDAETGTLVLSLCLADGTVTEKVIDLDPGGEADHGQPDMRGGCPFSVTATPVLPVADHVVFASAVAVSPVVHDAVAHARLAGESRPPLPARGPPTRI